MNKSLSWFLSFALGFLILGYFWVANILPMDKKIQYLEAQNKSLKAEIKLVKTENMGQGLNSEGFYSWFQKLQVGLKLLALSEEDHGLNISVEGNVPGILHLFNMLEDSRFLSLSLTNLSEPDVKLNLHFEKVVVANIPEIVPVKPAANVSTRVLGKIKKNGTCFIVIEMGDKIQLRKNPAC